MLLENNLFFYLALLSLQNGCACVHFEIAVFGLFNDDKPDVPLVSKINSEIVLLYTNKGLNMLE